MGRVMRNLVYCILENKYADKLRGYRAADHCLRFRCLDSINSLLYKLLAILLYGTVCVAPGRTPRRQIFLYAVHMKVFWFNLMLNAPVNNFLVMLERNHCFLVIISRTFFYLFIVCVCVGGVNMSCSRTQHGDPSGARTPTSRSGVRGVNHQAPAPPYENISKILVC